MLLDATDEVRGRILEEVHSSRRWLLNELSALSAERGCSITEVDAAALQAVLIRRTPEVCALMAKTLLKVSPGEGGLLIEYFVGHNWLRLPALADLAKALEAVWFEYLPYLHNWQGWEPVDTLDSLVPELNVQCFRRPADGKYVADFVGLVPWPDLELEPPDPRQAAYRRDVDTVYEALDSEWGCDFLALRCLTRSADGLAVHWLSPDSTDDDELAEIDELTP